MKRPYLVVLLLCTLLFSSCQEETVVLDRETLIQGNWEQYMITQSYYDKEGKLQDVVYTPTRKAIRISKDQLKWGNHNDGYDMQVLGKLATISQSCSDLPRQNKINGVTNEHPDWMSWTSTTSDVTYVTAANQRSIASKVETTIEFRRIDIVK